MTGNLLILILFFILVARVTMIDFNSQAYDLIRSRVRVLDLVFTRQDH